MVSHWQKLVATEKPDEGNLDAEITSGRSFSQQGLTATCIDPLSEGTTEAVGGLRTGA